MTTSLVVLAAALWSQPVAPRADAVSEWMDRTVAIGYRAGGSPLLSSRCVALVALAMFDAWNTVDPRFTPYRATGRASAGASGDAAAAAAAHYILVRAYPDFTAELDSALRIMLAGMADPPGRDAGVRLGRALAADLWNERASDGSTAPNPYRPAAAAGVYVPTLLPAGATWGNVRPFALAAGHQFRPAPPPALASKEWAADYNEVKRLGRKENSARTPEQTQIARFWEYTGPGTYMPVARQVADARSMSPVERARLYALAAVAAADALIAVFDAKFTYGFWRPVTAIRNGDLDGNDATEHDPEWEPLINTPLHPEYPCAHCVTQTAVASVLEAVVGDSQDIRLVSPTAPGVTRRFRRLSDYANEVLEARIYDGVHYRGSGNVGAAMGRHVAAYVVGHVLTPRP
jgi:hypothetical protein